MWRKSTYSASNGQCVEVAVTDDGIALRDSKLGDASPVLNFTHTEWDAFTAGVRDGQFD